MKKLPLKSIKAELLKKTGDFKVFTESDKIIAFLNYREEKGSLPAHLKKKMDRYFYIHNLRLRYKQRSYIVGHLEEFYNRTPRQASNDIAEAEYIFGKVNKIDRAYQVSMLIEMSFKNLELAATSKDVNLFTKALELHFKLLGPPVDDSETPDASKWQQHTYNIIMSPNASSAIEEMVSKGAINLDKLLPGKKLQIQAK